MIHVLRIPTMDGDVLSIPMVYDEHTDERYVKLHGAHSDLMLLPEELRMLAAFAEAWPDEVEP